MVEVIIVVAIIAVLASIIMPKMGGAKRKALLKSCIANEKHIAIAMEMYAGDNFGKYTPGTQTYYGGASYLVPEYLNRIPTCPAGHQYSVAENCSTWPNKIVIYTNNYSPGVTDPHPEVYNWYPAWVIGKGSLEGLK